MFWPYESILGGPNRQKITYDQLPLTQFVQGFARNVLEESNHQNWKFMVFYLSDLMEDATDFSWSNSKAVHAVLLFNMERGALPWIQTELSNRICHAHVQKHDNCSHNCSRLCNEQSKKSSTCLLALLVIGQKIAIF